MKVHNPNKRVTIVLIKDIVREGEETIKAGDVVMRTTRSYAEQVIKQGFYAYCSKSKLKSYLNKNKKLTHNMRTIERLQNLTGDTYPERRNGKDIIIEVPTVRFANPEPVVRQMFKQKGITHKYDYNRSNGARLSYTQLEVGKVDVKFKPSPNTIEGRKMEAISRKRGKDKDKPLPIKVERTGTMRLVAAFG